MIVHYCAQMPFIAGEEIKMHKILVIMQLHCVQKKVRPLTIFAEFPSKSCLLVSVNRLLQCYAIDRTASAHRYTGVDNALHAVKLVKDIAFSYENVPAKAQNYAAHDHNKMNRHSKAILFKIFGLFILTLNAL